jgi:hypothetical protein
MMINTLNLRGMSYEQASRKGAELVAMAQKTGRWFDLPEQLAELRLQMKAQS